MDKLGRATAPFISTKDGIRICRKPSRRRLRHGAETRDCFLLSATSSFLTASPLSGLVGKYLMFNSNARAVGLSNIR